MATNPDTTSYTLEQNGFATFDSFGMTWQGAWVLSVGYALNDVVSNGGSSYICILAHTASADDEPGVGVNTATYWNQLASKGDTGATGAAGGTGPMGGLMMTWQTETAGDPGTGGVRGNAAQASITEIALDDLDNSGVNIESLIQFLDDSTTTDNRAILTISSNANPDQWVAVSITATFADQTGYWTAACTVVDNGATITDGSAVSVVYAITGDIGATGPAGPATVPNDTVRAASTANVVLATAVENGDTLDGVVLATGDLILLKDQSAASENGIYVVAASGAPARDGDYDTYDEHPGKVVSVQEGTANADTVWLCTSNLGGVLETTAIDFAEVAPDATAAVAGLVKVGIANDSVPPAKNTPVSGEFARFTADGIEGRSEAEFKADYNLEIGTDVQAWDPNLDQIAALAVTTDTFLVGSGAGTWGLETAAQARTSLGVVIGTNVQAWSTHLDTIAAISKADGTFIVGNGSTFVGEDPGTARASLGLGSAALVATGIANGNVPAVGNTPNAGEWAKFIAGGIEGRTHAELRSDASIAQTSQFEMWSWVIETPANQDYRLIANIPYGVTINDVTTRTAAGSCTVTGKINTTALGGAANTADTVEETQTHSSANVMSSGDDFVVTISATSSADRLTITVKATRVFNT